MMRVFEEQEMKLQPILASMESCGISIDLEHLTKNCDVLKKRISLLEQRAAEWAGHTFLLSSPKQVANVLYQELKLSPPDALSPSRSTTQSPKKHPSTSEEALLALQEKHALPGIILEHRHLLKLLRTYIEPFVIHAKKRPHHESTGGTPRIFGRWNQMTATGRLSSLEPNLQNLPRSESLEFFLDGTDCVVPINIRDSFIAQPGTIFVSSDYSQLEMRILAHLSKDESLLQFFNEGNDFFKLVGSRLWNKPSAAINEKERELAKRVCYGVVYGAGAVSLARDTNMTVSKAKVFIERFFEKFPSLGRWVSAVRKQANNEESVRTLFKRKRPLPDIRSNISNCRAAAERQAVNTIIQGTASDLVKQAMVVIDTHIKQDNMKSKLLIQVHDELVYETPLDELEKMSVLVKRCMEETPKLDIRLPVQVKVGERLGSMKLFPPVSHEAVSSPELSSGDVSVTPDLQRYVPPKQPSGKFSQPTSKPMVKFSPTSLNPSPLPTTSTFSSPAPKQIASEIHLPKSTPLYTPPPVTPASAQPFVRFGAPRLAPPRPPPTQESQITYTSSLHSTSSAPTSSPQLLSPPDSLEPDDLFNDASLLHMELEEPDGEGDDLGIGSPHQDSEIEHPHDEIVSEGPEEVLEEDFSLPDEELASMENEMLRTDQP